MPATTSQARQKSLRLRRDAVTTRRDAAGIGTNAQLAERAGVAESTLQRAIAGTVRPSAEFIAGLLAALPGTSFDDLFEVVPAEQQQ
jgi:transcriptional regulator with XRE-family HTH domain